MHSTCRILFLSALAVFASAVVAAADPDRPNVVIIAGDDVGWPYHGFMPSPQVLQTNAGPLAVQEIVQTPNLDTLASEGVTFTRGYSTASLCQPSLMSFLSSHGLHAFQWRARELELESVSQIGDIPYRRESHYLRTLPRELERRGYVSWEGGKMWYGTYEDAGFTDGLATSVGGFFQTIGDHFGRDDWDTALCGSTAPPEASCPALDPMREFLDGTDGRPFFLWFAPLLPHTPFDAPQEYRDPYEALGLPFWAVNYLANMTWFDELVGELLAELEERGLAENTLVIYASDNGWGLGFQFFPGQGKGKGTLYDLGFRTPILFRWPARIPAGATYDDLVSTSDIPATILDYVFGKDAPAGAVGLSLRERLEGGAPVGRSEIVTYDAGKALVNDTWRYLQFPDGHEELYRIDLDPFEEVDLAAANPQVLDQLAAEIEAHTDALEAPPSRTEIVGRLVHWETGEPLEGAEVRLDGGPSTLASIVGPGGWFEFGPLDPSVDYGLRRNRNVANDFRDDRTGTLYAGVEPSTSTGIFHTFEASPTTTLSGEFGATLVGTLSEEGTGDPLEGLVVMLSGRVAGRKSTARVVTQPDGRFRVANLGAPATYRIAVKSTKTHRTVVRKIEVATPEDEISLDLAAAPK
ncbi:MAG: hypothetical protein FJ144_20910 [Deltaproteobacteria bacterium]|nr:hypothetical protein [Deltaproteobacteria bacterium]